jgi:hypothetical protein
MNNLASKKNTGVKPQRFEICPPKFGRGLRGGISLPRSVSNYYQTISKMEDET